MSENRFLQSFSALLASAILVCGTHLLLIASSDYGRPQGEQQPAPVATPAPSAAPTAVRESIDVEVTGATPDRSHSDATLFAGDQTPVSPAPADAASSKPSPEMANEPVEKAEADAPPSGATPSPETKEKPIASAPEQVTPVVEPSEAPKPVEPAATADAEVTTPAEPQMAEAEQAADFTPITPAPSAIEPKAPSTPKLAEADSTPQSAQPVKADPVPPSVPLPTKKPEPAVNAKKLKPAAKQQAATAEAEEQQAATESKPRWAPMALAPANKDTVGKPKVAPKRADAGSYNARIWSALARHKPRTSKSGSATVTFSIGPAGGVRSVKVSGSSGDSQLDQMALQTVRNAAPFPPPPNPASASYTIRIYFR